MSAPADVLEVLHELRSLHVRTQGSAMSAHDGSLARIDASIAAVAEAFKRMAPDDYKPMPDRPVPMEKDDE